MADTDPTQFLRSSMPLAETLGMTARQADAEQVVLELAWAPELCTSGAVTEGNVVATSKPLHIGSSTIVVETDVTNGDRRVGKVLQTQSVLWPRR